MRKHILALAAMVLIAGVVSAAPKKGYKITVQIKNAKDTVLYMGYYSYSSLLFSSYQVRF